MPFGLAPRKSRRFERSPEYSPLSNVRCVACSLACGRIVQVLGQTRVIGEILVGILIGPSVFGRVAPHLFARLYPPGSLGSLESLSTVGLILFLFLVGSEVDHEHLRQQKATAMVTSFATIFIPFALALACYRFYTRASLPPALAGCRLHALCRISMSITAFPVLARILEESDLQRSSLGATGLLCAAIGDVTAWTLLAVAMTLIPSSSSPSVLPVRLIWLGLYLAVMFFVVRRAGRCLAARRFGSRYRMTCSAW